MTKKVIALGLVPLILVGTFLFLSAPFLERPASQDDFWNFESAKHMPETKIPLFYRGTVPHLEHPPLYLHLLSFFLRNFGKTLAAGRSLGVLAASLTLLVLFYFSYFFYRRDRYRLFLSFFSSFTLASSPLLIQGSQLIDIDGSLLLFSFSLMVFGWILLGGSSMASRNFGISLLFAFALCSKMITPLFLPFGIFVTAFFSRRTHRELWRFLCPFGLGFLWFIVLWFLYCLRQDAFSSFWDPIGYHVGAAQVWQQKRDLMLSFSGILGTLVRLGAWFSWPFLLLLGVGWTALMREKTKDLWGIKSVLNGILFACVGFVLMKGLSFSFPKYDVPFLPFFCLIAAWPIRSISVRSRSLILFFICLLSFTLFQKYVVGDLLYSLLFGLRQALLNGRGGEVALHLFQKGLLSFFSFLLAWGGVYLFEKRNGLRQAFLLTLGAMVIATNLSQTILQIQAPYMTGNLYGDSSRKETIALLKKILRPGDVLIAHDLIHFELGSFSSPFVPGHLWGDPEALWGLMEREKARALVYSLSIHTISQYRKTFLNPVLQDRLHQSFERYDLGTYTVWVRKDTSRRGALSRHE